MSDTNVRRTDPETSHAAAADHRVEKVRASQARVLQMFKLYGDMTDKELVARVRDAEEKAGFLRLMSDSGARTRRSELSKANMERLRDLRFEWYEANPSRVPVMAPIVAQFGREEYERAVNADVFAEADAWARDRLRDEGFRAPLWDTGRRQRGDGKYRQIVWGLAV